MSSITLEEKNKITDSNLHLFVARHVHDYWPCAINSQRMVDFLESQLGMRLAEWPYPLHLEQIETAFAYLQSQHMLFPRPEEQDVVDEAAAEEVRKQQKVRDDFDARQRTAQIERDRNMPLKDLGAKVSRQNSDFREQRDANLLPIRTPGLESRPLSSVTMGLKATARANTAIAHPELAIDSQEWNKFYAAELARLRG